MTDRGVQVLLVEDNPGDADLAALRLTESQHARFEVTVCTTLSAAIERIRRRPCEVILLDLELPDSRGVDTVRALRQSHRDTPIVVVSGSIDEAVRRDAIACGAEEVIAKAHLASPLFPLSVLYVVERNRARVRQQHLDRLLDAIPDAVIVVNRAGKVSYVNARALTMFDRDRDTLMSEPMWFAAPPGDVAEIQVPQGAGELIGELRVVETEWSGERSSLALIRDVTRQRNLEMQLLMSDRLATLGTLAAGIGHEINNPLASVMTNLEIALSELAALEGHDGLNEALLDAVDAAARIREIVGGLKVFSREGSTALEPVDVRTILDGVIRLAGNEVRHRARIVKSYAEVPLAQANESRLTQVFLNLVVNAAQAIPEGSADSNQITLATCTGPDGRVVVEIHDTGPGIPADVQRRMFTPFFTTKPVGSGTGLGLAITQRIVTELGGAIRFESREGSGTRFTVELPAATTAPVRRRRRTIAAAKRRGRVLVIDDEVSLLDSIAKLIEKQHDVVCFEHAADALGCLGDGERFDVILCDVMMPEMSGFDFAERVRAIDRDQFARVVYMTAGVFGDRMAAQLAALPNPRLEKPFDSRELWAIVNRHIE